jgi:hypothetical protein
MESKLGHDFSRVRIHSGPEAARSAHAVGAHAYTVGSDIVFGAGTPVHGAAGRRLLAHELTHVIQQRQAGIHPTGPLSVGLADDAYEQDARRVADASERSEVVETAASRHASDRPDCEFGPRRHRDLDIDQAGWMGARPARVLGSAARSCSVVEEAGQPEAVEAVDTGLVEEELPEAVEAVETGSEEEEELAVARIPPRPAQAAATIVCDGKGGYRVDMGGWAGAGCGIEKCVRRHEQSHAADWKARWPKGCKGKKNGDTIPLGGKGYAAFLKKSECKAYTTELTCVTGKYTKAKAKDPCKKTLKDHRDDTAAQKKTYC